ncbi:transposase [Streptomyces sp. NRRL S-1813]|uniref:transposase n=1 Tax=Streptomyces sp. NRRL S-1813 TaxID=1463888 RepID=UPI003B63E4CF
MSLTDVQWARIEPLLPGRTPKRGGRWRDHHEVIDAIAFKFRTGMQCAVRPMSFSGPRWDGRISAVRRRDRSRVRPRRWRP